MRWLDKAMITGKPLNLRERHRIYDPVGIRGTMSQRDRQQVARFQQGHQFAKGIGGDARHHLVEVLDGFRVLIGA